MDLSTTYPQTLHTPAHETPPAGAVGTADEAWNSPVYEEQHAELETLLAGLKQSLAMLDRCDISSPADESGPGARVTAALSESIVRMQDDFLRELCTGLKERGIDPSSKLTLRLDEDAALEAVGDGQAGAAAEDLLAYRPELTALFTETAVRAALLRGLYDLCSAVRHKRPGDIYAALNAGAGASRYQVSIKGDMSHFYFAR